MIEVKNLTKKYGNHFAVEDLSFRVEKGQIYGFLGPNGAGKSTTMNIMTGYLAPTSGTVTINGFDVMKEPEEAKKCIGYLPEMPPLYTDMTVKEYLDFCVELKKVPKKNRAEQVAYVMAMTGIEHMANRLIKNLSKGYKQRVGLAQAILGDPEVIILDEPSVGLDPMQIIEIRELIKKLGENHTVILSSHILSEVSAVCDQIMIISHGKLVANDTLEGLQKQFAAQRTLILTVKGDEEVLKETAASMEGVLGVEIQKDAVTGLVNANIALAEDADIREALSIKLAEMKMPVISMVLDEKQLEDIFIELTGSDDTLAQNTAKEIKKEHT